LKPAKTKAEQLSNPLEQLEAIRDKLPDGSELRAELDAVIESMQPNAELKAQLNRLVDTIERQRIKHGLK